MTCELLRCGHCGHVRVDGDCCDECWGSYDIKMDGEEVASLVNGTRADLAAANATIEKLWLVMTYSYKFDFRRTPAVEAIKNRDADALCAALGVEVRS